MLTVLRQRNFALLWWGGLISMLGDWMLRIALPAQVFAITGSTLATGVMIIAGMAPTLLVSSVAGVYVDRWDRQRTMVATNLLLAASVVPLSLVRGSDSLWIVYLVAVVQSTLSQLFGPAEHALLPLIVSREHLTTANALNALNNNLARLGGPALGGIVAATIGLTGVALIDATTFVIAALLISLVRTTGHAPREARAAGMQHGALSMGSIWHAWVAGLKVVRRDRLLTLLFSMIALVGFGEGIVSVLFVPFVLVALDGQVLELGWLMSAQAVGGLVGGLLIAQISHRISAARLLGPSTLLFGLIDLVIFVSPLVVPSFSLQLVLFVLVGVPSAGFGASLTTLLQDQTSDAYRGRVFGAQTMTLALTGLCGMSLAAVLGDRVGIVPIISIQGGVYCAAGVLAILWIRRPDAPAARPGTVDPR